MKNIFICLFAMFFLSNCTDDKDELIIGEPNKEGTTSKPSLENGIEKLLMSSTSTIPDWKKLKSTIKRKNITKQLKHC